MLSNRKKIVVIGDDAVSLYTITELLADNELRVIPLRQGSGTLDAVKFVRPHLILLDNAMPASSAAAVRKLLERDEETRSIPRISCSSTDGEMLRNRVQRHETGGAGDRLGFRPGTMREKYFSGSRP
jgi:CheY-like chemotaxis protein